MNEDIVFSKIRSAFTDLAESVEYGTWSTAYSHDSRVQQSTIRWTPGDFTLNLAYHKNVQAYFVSFWGPTGDVMAVARNVDKWRTVRQRILEWLDLELTETPVTAEINGNFCFTTKKGADAVGMLKEWMRIAEGAVR